MSWREELGVGQLLNNRVIGNLDMWRGAPLLATNPEEVFQYQDDFYTYDDTATVGDYAEAGGGIGAVSAIDAVGGELSIASGANDNDEGYVSSLQEIALFATLRRVWIEFRIKLAEANTDDANIIIGLSDTVGANTLLDNGAGPAASYDGAVFFKVDGGTVWQFETSNAGTQNTDTNLVAFNDDTYTRLGFVFDPQDGTTAKVTPYIDGQRFSPLNLTIAGLEEMHILMGVKAGGANAETLLVDSVRMIHDRIRAPGKLR